MKQKIFSKKFALILFAMLAVSLLLTNIFLHIGTRSRFKNTYRFNDTSVYTGNLDSIFEQYLEGKKDNAEKWMSFMAILSTLFAVFFVYSGFKIDSTKDKVDEAGKRILEIEKRMSEDILEYTTQLQYAMSFIIQKKYTEAIDTLTVLRSEHFVLKDSRKINTCCFFLAHCYYEKGRYEKKKDDLALAVEYINQAIADPSHPFRNEIINEFNKLDK